MPESVASGSFRFTQAGRKHCVGERRIRYAIEHPLVSYRVPAPTDDQDDRTLYLGEDQLARRWKWDG